MIFGAPGSENIDFWSLGTENIDFWYSGIENIDFWCPRGANYRGGTLLLAKTLPNPLKKPWFWHFCLKIAMFSNLLLTLRLEDLDLDAGSDLEYVPL